MATNISLKSIQSQLNKIKKSVNPSMGSGKNKKLLDLEEPAIKEALNMLQEAVSGLASLLESGDQLCPKIRELEEKNRVLEDEVDHQAQKRLKGKFMLTSASKTANVIKSEEDLEKEGTPLLTHIQNLIQMKLGVEVPAEDISSCSRTSTGLLLFRLSNFRPSSSFYSVVDAIKSGKNRDIDLFFNFALTRRRAAMLYEVRKLKKAGKLHKFFTDFDGQITVKKTPEAKKIKICSVGNKKDSYIKTDTISELRDRLDQV